MSKMNSHSPDTPADEQGLVHASVIVIEVLEILAENIFLNPNLRHEVDTKLNEMKNKYKQASDRPEGLDSSR